MQLTIKLRHKSCTSTSGAVCNEAREACGAGCRVSLHAVALPPLSAQQPRPQQHRRRPPHSVSARQHTHRSAPATPMLSSWNMHHTLWGDEHACCRTVCSTPSASSAALCIKSVAWTDHLHTASVHQAHSHFADGAIRVSRRDSWESQRSCDGYDRAAVDHQSLHTDAVSSVAAPQLLRLQLMSVGAHNAVLPVMFYNSHRLATAETIIPDDASEACG